MLDRLYTVWITLRTSLWFVPAVMSVGAVGLAVLALNLDANLPDGEARGYWWLHSGGPADARNLLSTLFSSMITMTTLVISITMVVLALAASQLGPRLVRSFMADPRTQLVLGIFLMTIIYCLLVLRTISDEADATDVPHIAVTLGTALALTNVFALLFFLHNLARSIVSDTVVRRVGADLGDAIARLLPAEKDGCPDARPVADDALPADFDKGAAALPLSGEGYVQAVEYERLVAIACRHQAVFRLDFRAGHFVIPGTHRIDVYPGRLLAPDMASEIEGAILIGEERTPIQDLEFSIRHLVEIAVRALSPGINDPFTAIAVIDRLGAALGQLLRRDLQPDLYRDGAGVVRVVGRAPGFGGLADAAFNQIRQAGATHPAVIIHMLNTIKRLAAVIRLPGQRDVLVHHAAIIAAAGCREAAEVSDRADIERSHRAAQAALENGAQ